MSRKYVERFTKMSWKRFLSRAGAGFVVVVLVGCGVHILLSGKWAIWYGKHTRPVNNNLHFSFTACSTEGGPLFDAFVEEEAWRTPTTKYYKIVIPANCGDIYWFGDYTLHEETLTLEYATVQPDFLACGACPVTLEYTITDLPSHIFHTQILETEILR